MDDARQSRILKAPPVLLLVVLHQVHLMSLSGEADILRGTIRESGGAEGDLGFRQMDGLQGQI